MRLRLRYATTKLIVTHIDSSRLGYHSRQVEQVEPLHIIVVRLNL